MFGQFRGRMIAASIALSGSVAFAADFHGYPCTQDCEGHEAGYQWAEDNGITDPDDCDGNSQSFIEGCQAYAEEQIEPEETENGEEE